MLTADQIEVLGEKAQQLITPVTDFLIAEIARRISEAGQLTSTAQYQIWKAQRLGLSMREIKAKLRKMLHASGAEIEKLLTQSAKVGYSFDLNQLPTAAAISFEDNPVIQQIVSAAVQLAKDDLSNITQTIGFVTPNGKAVGLTDAYNQACDFAFMKVSTGAQDYNSAIRQATKALADKGIVTINYESGVHTSLESAVRRNVMGALGLMQEQISRQNHDDLGCDGWEISAHAASAPDHEPIQGKQYSDAEFDKLNNSLVRRIGTLNCGHSAFPIILGVDSPQYTKEELEEMRRDNENGIDYEGHHYTKYEATQRQRQLERAIRKQKRRILVDESTGDKEKLRQDQIKYQVLSQEYKRFSKAAGLRLQHERMEMAGFGPKQAMAAEKAAFDEQAKLARASDTFVVVPPIKGDAIKPQSIYKELQKSEVGKHAYDFITNNSVNVEINYTDEFEEGTRGFTLGNSIFIYAKNTKTIRLTTETIIHEVAHVELGTSKRTQWEEAYCFSQEAKHTKKQLTFDDLKGIIKTVKMLYPEYPWR